MQYSSAWFNHSQPLKAVGKDTKRKKDGRSWYFVKDKDAHIIVPHLVFLRCAHGNQLVLMAGQVSLRGWFAWSDLVWKQWVFFLKKKKLGLDSCSLVCVLFTVMVDGSIHSEHI